MEKFFIVTDKSKLYFDYMAYKQNISDVNEVVKEFRKEQNIEATEYSVWYDSFYIIPTDKDRENFNKMLCNPVNDGLRRFKDNSKIGKAWKNKGIKTLHKPFVRPYFKSSGNGSSRLFDINNVVYCSFRADDVNIPDEMIEIKGSEFYKIMENITQGDNYE